MQIETTLARLASAKTTEHFRPPRRFWRSLDELSESEEFWRWAEREFPEGASEFSDPLGRREFLRVMGAALVMAGFGACSRPPQMKIVPYVEQPEEIKPDRPLFFATVMVLGGFATGLLDRYASRNGNFVRVS